MPVQVGEVSAIYRYPVKSMGGELVASAELGWFGLVGDRRLGLRRLEDRGGFPWLTAGRLPELLQFTPLRRSSVSRGEGPEHAASRDQDDLPTHVRTPEGVEFAVFDAELAAEIGRRHGAPLEMMYLDRGIFDEASVSVMTAATVAEIGRISAQPADVRRFRPNIVITTLRSLPFEEDGWVGGSLCFGPAPDDPPADGEPDPGVEVAAVSLTHHDVRCSMVNLDPVSGRSTPDVLKSIVRERDSRAGVYGTATRRGRIAVGQPVYLLPPMTAYATLEERLRRALTLTSDLVAHLDEAALGAELPGLPSNRLSAQLWCVAGARESYLAAIEAGAWQGFRCSLETPGVRSAVLASLAASRERILALDFASFGEVELGFAFDLLEHEVQHHGQLIRFVYGNGFSFPESWNRRYTV